MFVLVFGEASERADNFLVPGLERLVTELSGLNLDAYQLAVFTPSKAVFMVFAPNIGPLAIVLQQLQSYDCGVSCLISEATLRLVAGI